MLQRAFVVSVLAASVLAASVLAVAGGPPAAAEAVDQPLVVELDEYFRFTRGAALTKTDYNRTRVAATYGWKASDPDDGICQQDLTVWAIQQDVLVFRGLVAALDRRVRVSAVVGGGHSYEDSFDHLHNIYIWVENCAGEGAGDEIFAPFTSLHQDAEATYSPGWALRTCTCYSGGWVRSARTAGATAEFSFTGHSVGVVMTKAPDRGRVAIHVDGRLREVVDLAGPLRHRVVVASYVLPALGDHSVTLTSIGDKRVDIDALVVS